MTNKELLERIEDARVVLEGTESGAIERILDILEALVTREEPRAQPDDGEAHRIVMRLCQLAGWREIFAYYDRHKGDS